MTVTLIIISYVGLCLFGLMVILGACILLYSMMRHGHASKSPPAKAAKQHAQEAQSGIVRHEITRSGATIKVIQLNLPPEMIKALSVGLVRLPSAKSQ